MSDCLLGEQVACTAVLPLVSLLRMTVELPTRGRLA